VRISVGEKNEVIEQYKLGNLEDAIKLLIKLNNKRYEHVRDKHFIYKTLVVLYKKIEEGKDIQDRDYTIANYYLNNAYNNIKEYKDSYEDEYYEIIWLHVGINESTLSNDILLSYYKEIKEYYDKIDYRRNSIALQINISKIEKDYWTIIDCLLEVIEYNDDGDFYGMKDAILQEIENTFGDTYLNLAIKTITDKIKDNHIALIK